MNKIMGIDYGDARTGVAISDLLCSIVGSTYVVPSRNAEKALAQINEKGYADPYHTDGRPIIKIGVNFSSEERTIEGWKVEEELKVKN